MTTAATTAVPSEPVHFALDDAAQPQGGFISSFGMMAAILAIFYFLLIRPQQKEQKAHQALLGGLQKGDKVVTSSGLHGSIHEVKDTVVVVEIADKVRVEMDKAAVKRKVGGE